MDEIKKQEMGTSQEIPLIDFIYKDYSRIDSFIAQMTAGALRNVKYRRNVAQGSNSSMGGGIPNLLNLSNTAIDTETKEKEETYEPHDYAILNLLEQLELSVLSELPSEATGKLVHIRGRITLRNTKTAIDVFPLLLKSPEIFGIPKKEVPQLKGGLSILSKIIRPGLEIDILLDDKNLLCGYIKEEYLTVEPYDLLRLYGSTFPGYWHIIGVLDDAKRHDFSQLSEMKQAINQISDIVRNMYAESDALGWGLFPILIFRELDK